MHKIINIKCDEDIIFDRLAYTIEFINSHPLKPHNVLFRLNNIAPNAETLYYKSSPNNTPFVPAQNLFFSSALYPNPVINNYNFECETVYSVEKVKKEYSDFFTGGKYGFDIFETVFYHISRYEEVYCSIEKLDIHKRMKSSEQLLVKNELHYSPVVDSLVFCFFKSLGIVAKDKETTFSLTHDIDIIRKYSSFYKSLKSIAKIIQMNLGFSGMARIIKSLLNTFQNTENDPYFTYNWLFVKDKKFVNKTVYFVAGGNTRYDLYDKYYLKQMPEILKKAMDSNYKIGYHPSYEAYNTKKLFQKEYNLLEGFVNTKILNIRTHYLRLDIQRSFELFEEFGLEYDSTLGYADDIGFRCGTGFEYNPYNFKEERAWRFREIPLVFMDSSLIYSVCRDNIDCFKAKAKAFFKLNKHNTHITINFHNSTFDYSLEFRNGLKEFYMELISEI